MSKENLDQFIQKVTDSEELQARIGEEMDADSLVALGAEHGCEFSADDLTAGAELSDEELDGVSGGLIAIIAIAALKEPKYRIGNKYNPGKGFRDITDGSSNT
ncbi:MAG TPA: Nif11-like leader peptide family natural product precursor [Gammaproteobacteria bacterium]|nr:Nif11-like leader peptide family natural product precursor [Gammaproteobacteria bacterium]